MLNLHERMLPTRRGSNPPPPDHQSDTHPTEPPRLAQQLVIWLLFSTHHNCNRHFDFGVCFVLTQEKIRIDMSHESSALDLIFFRKTNKQNKTKPILIINRMAPAISLLSASMNNVYEGRAGTTGTSAMRRSLRLVNFMRKNSTWKAIHFPSYNLPDAIQCLMPDATQLNVASAASGSSTAGTRRLTITTLWVDSADDKLMIFFLFFLENRIWHFMQIVSVENRIWHFMQETICMKYQSLFSRKNKKKIFENVVCWNFYPACKVLNVTSASMQRFDPLGLHLSLCLWLAYGMA